MNKTVYAPAPNAALREIAGRIKRLSYRDMVDLVSAIGVAMESDADISARALLEAAETLESR